MLPTLASIPIGLLRRAADMVCFNGPTGGQEIIPVDASGNNGYSEVEVWATTGPQYSNNICVNKIMVPQTMPQAVL